MLTLKQVQETLPINHRQNMTQDLVDQLNSLSTEPEEARYMRENFVSFSQVLQEGKYKLGDYVKAVMYVSHKVMGKSNHASYKATFPDRYQTFEDNKKSSSVIASYVSGYNKGQLVTKVMQLAIVPSWILNQDMFQSALQTQYELMTDIAVSDKVRCDAANSLLTHLKKPEDNKAELKIELVVNDGMLELEKALSDMSREQIHQIEHNPNVTTQDIAARPLKAVN